MTNESNLVGLIAHNTSIGRHIEAEERHAIVRCKDYDATKIYWKTCDNLIHQ